MLLQSPQLFVFYNRGSGPGDDAEVPSRCPRPLVLNFPYMNMKRNLSLFVLTILLDAGSLKAASPDRGCGTVPGQEAGARLTHSQNQRLMRARKGRSAERIHPAKTAGDLVVMDSGGGIVGQRNPFNLDRQVVRFTPQIGGYRFAVAPGEVEDLSTQSTVIAGLGDDDSREFALPFAFPFQGQTRNRVFLNSDGNLTFDRADGSGGERSLGRFTAGGPRIAALFLDLDPSAAGQVSQFSSPERMVFTWSRVPDYRTAGVGLPNTFQIRLYRDGRIELAYGGINALEGVVGISRGDVSNPAQVVSFTSGSNEVFPGSVAELFTLGNDLDLVTLAQRFYSQFDDAYDYLVVYNTMGLPAGAGVVAFEITVRNDRTGFGDLPANTGAEYGSKQRMQAILNLGPTSQYPVDPFGTVPARGAAGDTPLSIIGHEAGHLFLAYASVRDPANPDARPMLGGQLAHWNFAFNSEASLLEGNRIRDNGPAASPRFETTATVEGYAPLDQYLMGFRAPEEVPATFLVTNSSLGNFNRGPQRGVRFDGQRRDVTIEEIVEAEGRRAPDHTVAQRRFRFAFVVLTAEGTEPTAAQLAQVERYRQEFPAYYAHATDNRATAETRLLKALRFRAEPAIGVIEGQTIEARVEIDRPAASAITLRPRSAGGTGAAGLPATVTIAAGATSVAIPLRGIRSGVDEVIVDVSVENGAEGFEAGRVKVQVLRAASELGVRITEGERLISRPGDPPQVVIARVVDRNYVNYPGLDVTAKAIGGGAVSPARRLADAAGEVRFLWTPGGSLELQVTGGGSATAQAFYLPVVYDGGVINAAFREASVQGLSPGGVASIYGIDLATTTPAQSARGNTLLGNTQVLVGGQAARLLYVSRGQINFVMPLLTPGVYPLTVTTAAGVSVAKLIALDAAWPGVFGARVNGNTIEIDATGLGPIGTPVRVLLDDADLTVLSAGSGDIRRVIARVPVALNGPQQLRLEAGGRLSNPVTVAL